MFGMYGDLAYRFAGNYPDLYQKMREERARLGWRLAPQVQNSQPAGMPFASYPQQVNAPAPSRGYPFRDSDILLDAMGRFSR